jgi:hypothetical protein
VGEGADYAFLSLVGGALVLLGLADVRVVSCYGEVRLFLPVELVGLLLSAISLILLRLFVDDACLLLLL